MKIVFNKIWGFGIASESFPVVTDDLEYAARFVYLNIFLGPLLIKTNFPITPWKKR